MPLFMAKLVRLEASALKLSAAGTLYFRMADSGNSLFRSLGKIARRSFIYQLLKAVPAEGIEPTLPKGTRF